MLFSFYHQPQLRKISCKLMIFKLLLFYILLRLERNQLLELTKSLNRVFVNTFWEMLLKKLFQVLKGKKFFLIFILLFNLFTLLRFRIQNIRDYKKQKKTRNILNKVLKFTYICVTSDSEVLLAVSSAIVIMCKLSKMLLGSSQHSFDAEVQELVWSMYWLSRFCWFCRSP